MKSAPEQNSNTEGGNGVADTPTGAKETPLKFVSAAAAASTEKASPLALVELVFANGSEIP